VSAGLDLAEYEALLRADFAGFAERAFHELYPQTEFLANWHQRVIAAKLEAVFAGRIRRLIVNEPPRQLKSHYASVAFPAWCLGQRPSLQFLCVSYAQDLADKLARDSRSIMISPWYRRIFPTLPAATRPNRMAARLYAMARRTKQTQMNRRRSGASYPS